MVKDIPTMVTDIYQGKRIDEARKRYQQTIRFWITLDSFDTILDSVCMYLLMRNMNVHWMLYLLPIITRIICNFGKINIELKLEGGKFT